jgi:RimJ/RimL family protein N-acetyltransferase
MRDRTVTDGIVALRRWHETDADELAACANGDDVLAVWLDRLPQPYTRADALAYIRGETVPGEQAYCITDAETGRVLGSIGLNPKPGGDGVVEVGYWMRADARGRGLMTRALRLAAGKALDDGAARVQLRADPENVASCRVAEKAGFTREGVLRSAHWNPRLGRRQDWAMFSLLPSER